MKDDSKKVYFMNREYRFYRLTRHMYALRLYLLSTPVRRQIPNKTVTPMSDQSKRLPDNEIISSSGPVYSLFETFPEPVYVIDPDGILLDANSKVAERFGSSLRECIGTSIYELINSCDFYPKGTGSVRKKQVQNVLSAGIPMTFDDELNGQVIRCDIYPVHASSNEICRLFVITRNITEQKRAERNSAELLARTNTALESVSAAIWNVDMQSGTVLRSPGHYRLYGYDSVRPELTSEDLLTQVVDEDRPRCIETLRQARETPTEGPWQLEFRVRWPDGSLHWLQSTWRIFFDDSGKPLSWSGMIQEVTEKKEAEERYREMLLQWDFTLDRCHIGVWDEDFRKGVARHSAEHSRIFGYDVPVLDWNFERFISHLLPEDRSAIETLYHKVLATRNHWDTEYRIRRKDGLIRWLSDTGAVTRDEKGAPIRLMGITRDITEQKAKEEELKSYKAEMEFALENSHIGVWKFDLKKLSLAISIEQAHILGYKSIPAEWNYEKVLRHHILPEDQSWINRLVNDAITQRTSLQFECRLRRADGQIRWVSILGTHQFDPDGNIDRMLGITTDITTRKLAEITLEKNRQQLTQALTATRAGAWSWDLKTGMVFCSDEFWAMSGFTSKDNEKPFDFFIEKIHPEDRELVIETATLASRTGSDIVDMEHRLCRPDGSFLWLTTRGIPQRDESGQVGSYIGTSIDITDRKREEAERENLQQQLQQSRKMELLGRIAGGVAHDFNNIIAIILGNTELLLSSPATNPASIEKLTTIENAARRSANIVQQLLGFARKQRTEPSILSVDAELESLLPMLRQLVRGTIRIEQHLEAFPAQVYIDPGQLFQIVTNLVVNARDAIEESGTITISSRRVQVGTAAQDETPDLPPGEYIQISVADTGTGIDSEILPYIFEPFYTTKEIGKGTGLGLATVYGIVKQNGGCIWCESQPGSGTRFDIRLPVHTGEQLHDEDNQQDEQTEQKKKCILVVEDEPELIRLVRQILEEEGYRVLTALDAEQALRLAPEALAGIDLLLTDVLLPGLSGIELTHALRTKLPSLPVIFMSGYTDTLFTNPDRVPGDTNLLPKPYTISDLKKLVSLMLAGR